MLGELRRHSKSFLIYLLFAMIIVVFIFTFNTGAGKGGGCGGQEVPVYSEVGSAEIDLDTYIMCVRLLPGYIRTPEGASFALASGVDLQLLSNPDFEEMAPGQATAFMKFIELIYLTSDKAMELGLRVDAEEMKVAMYSGFYKEEITTDEMGLETTQKVFDKERFRNFVTYRLHASEKEYEQFTRRILLSFKLHGIMANTVQDDVLGNELLARGQEYRANLSFVELAVEDFTEAIEPGQEEIDAFVAENGDEIQKYYDAHPAEFKWDDGVRILGILSAPEEVAEGEDAVDPKEDAQSILRRLTGEEELFPGGKLPLDIDPSKGSMTLSAADLNRPVPTDPVQRFKELAKRESDDMQTRSFQGQFLGWLKTEDITRRLSVEMAKAVEEAEAGAYLGPFETENGFWVLMVAEKRTARDLDLESAKPQIAAKLLKKEKGLAMAKSAAETLLNAVKSAEGYKLDEALKSVAERDEYENALMAVSVEETGVFSLTQTLIPGLRDVQNLKDDLYDLTVAEPVAPKVYSNTNEDAFYVVALQERNEPPAELPEEKLEQAGMMGELSLRAMYYPAWLKGLHQTALEEGKISRTAEFNNYLGALEQQLNEQLQKKLQESGIPAAQ